MSFPVKVIPFGTTRRVTVDSFIRDRGEKAALVAHDDQMRAEGYVLILHRDDPSIVGVEAGDTGTITFVEGGIMGGHWEYKGDAKETKAVSATQGA